MTYASILNTLGSYERQYGAATFSVTRHGDASRSTTRSPSTTSSPATSPSMGAAAYVVGADHGADRQRLREGRPRAARPHDHVDRGAEDGDARARLARRSAAARRAHGAAQGAAPHLSRRGDRADAADRDSGERQRHAVAAGVGRRAARRRPSSARRARRSRAASTQMIRALNKARRNNTLYVKLLGSDAGAVVNGELLSSLPPSVLAVLEGRPQRRQLQPAAQRDARRVGAPDRAGGQRRRGR